MLDPVSGSESIHELFNSPASTYDDIVGEWGKLTPDEQNKFAQNHKIEHNALINSWAYKNQSNAANANLPVESPVKKTPEEWAADDAKKFHTNVYQGGGASHAEVAEQFSKLSSEVQAAFKKNHPYAHDFIQEIIKDNTPSAPTKSNLVAKDVYEMHTWKDMADNWGKLSESEQEKFKKTYHGMYASLRETPHFKGLGIKWDVTDPYQGNV